MIWDFVDSINCLTVQNSPRLKGLINNLKTVGISPRKVNVWTFQKTGENNGGKNCTALRTISDTTFGTDYCCDKTCQAIHNNHKAIIKAAYDSGHSSTMIFEDDARFNLPFDYEKLNRIKDWMKNNNWDVLYFGSVPIVPLGMPVSRDIVYSSYPLLMHNYVVSRSGMEKILHLPNDPVHIDVQIGRDISIKKYCVYPSINNQIEQPHMNADYLENYQGTLNKLLETLQFYSVIVFISLFLLYLYILR
jgi:hypothetical protein